MNQSSTFVGSYYTFLALKGTVAEIILIFILSAIFALNYIVTLKAWCLRLLAGAPRERWLHQQKAPSLAGLRSAGPFSVRHPVYVVPQEDPLGEEQICQRARGTAEHLQVWPHSSTSQSVIIFKSDCWEAGRCWYFPWLCSTPDFTRSSGAESTPPVLASPRHLGRTRRRLLPSVASSSEQGRF